MLKSDEKEKEQRVQRPKHYGAFAREKDIHANNGIVVLISNERGVFYGKSDKNRQQATYDAQEGKYWFTTPNPYRFDLFYNESDDTWTVKQYNLPGQVNLTKLRSTVKLIRVKTPPPPKVMFKQIYLFCNAVLCFFKLILKRCFVLFWLFFIFLFFYFYALNTGQYIIAMANSNNILCIRTCIRRTIVLETGTWTST